MHHSKSLKLWQLPNDFHPELSKGARCLYSRLLALSSEANKDWDYPYKLDCYYSNSQGSKEFHVTDSTIGGYMKELKDLYLIETTRSLNKRLVTVVRENAPTPGIVENPERPIQKQEQKDTDAIDLNNLPGRFEVRSWYTGETYEVTAEMVEQIYTKPPKLRRVVLRPDRCGDLSTDGLNLYSRLLALCDRAPCRCLYTDQQGLREFGFTPDQLHRLLKGLAIRGLIYFFSVEEQFLKGQVVYFVCISETKALLNILRTHADVEAVN